MYNEGQEMSEKTPEEIAAEEHIKGYQAGNTDHQRLMAFLAGIAWERERLKIEMAKIQHHVTAGARSLAGEMWIDEEKQ
jgi:hypothetical protein